MTREQLGALILDSERQLYSTAKTILYSDQDCADAIQDTIVKAFSKIDTLKNDKYARTWLVRILINECYSILRKSSKLVSLEEMNDKGESGGSMKTCGGADKEKGRLRRVVQGGQFSERGAALAGNSVLY